MRTVKMTLLTKENGWRKFQIKDLKIAFGERRVSSNLVYPNEVILLGVVPKNDIARIVNETKFTLRAIIGYDNPRLHHQKPF